MFVRLLLLLALSGGAIATEDCDFNCPGTSRMLLFALRTNNGMNSLEAFRNKSLNSVLDVDGELPSVYRNAALDNLPEAITSTKSNIIVVEMRKRGLPVAWAMFDVNEDVNTIDLENWFSPNRLIRTYPYWTGNSGFESFKVGRLQDQKYNQSFYIKHSGGGCNLESGLMGISDSATDACPWVAKGGKPPILFYSQGWPGPFMPDDENSNVNYASLLFIYLDQVNFNQA